MYQTNQLLENIDNKYLKFDLLHSQYMAMDPDFSVHLI